jgi:transcriptional regulator with XRE-family HTH domain
MLENIDKRLRTANHKARLPTMVDQEVGRRMRLRRKLLDLSQADLAEELGITHQQVQKYESGTTRLSASRLHQVACVLKVSVAWFFEGIADAKASAADDGLSASSLPKDAGAASVTTEAPPQAEPKAMRLLRLYYSIPDPSVREDLLGFLENFAERNR